MSITPITTTATEPTTTVIDRHEHYLLHEASDEFTTVPVVASYTDGMGPHVQLAGFSMTPQDARLLGLSLVQLANLFDADHLVQQ